MIPEASIDPETKKIRVRSKEEQEATARALKPHSRSTIALNELRNHRDKPEGMTPVPQATPKAKAKRWQFGIRSRNAPYEAMKCLYSALRAQNGDWEVIPALASDVMEEGKENIPIRPEEEVEPGQPHKVLQSRYPHLPRDYYVPRDPWFIRARMLKPGLFAPGITQSLSRSNSQTNVKVDEFKKRVSDMSGYISDDLQHHMSPSSSNGPSRPMSTEPTHTSEASPSVGTNQDAFTGPANRGSTPSLVSHFSTVSHQSDLSSSTPDPRIGVYVYIDIQLYMLETNNYMVDFKCDGYQNVIFVPEGTTRGSDSKASTRNTSTVTSPQHSRPTSGFDSMHSQSTSPTSNGFDGNSATNGNRMPDDTDASVTPPAADADPATTKGVYPITVNGVRGNWKPVSKRIRNKEKDVTSPYPYLDVASDLIAQLAVSN